VNNAQGKLQNVTARIDVTVHGANTATGFAVEHRVNVGRASYTILLGFLMSTHVLEVALMTTVTGLTGIIFVDVMYSCIFGKLCPKPSIWSWTTALDKTTTVLRTPIAKTDKRFFAELQAHLVQLFLASTVAEELEILETLCTVE